MTTAAMKRQGSPRKRGGTPVFGRSLEELYAENGGLPPVFWDTLRLLSLKALTTRGIFRQPPAGRPTASSRSSGAGSDGSDDSSGATDEADGANTGRKVTLCKRLYDSGQDALKVLPSTTKDLHAVAGILKLWVSSLPEPVIPPGLYAEAVATQTEHKTREAQVAALHALLRQCSHRVLQVLYPLMEFLHHYCLNQPSARRERAELARVFAPLVLRPPGRSVMAPPLDGGAAEQCVDHMIREYRTMFVARKRAVVPPELPAAKPSAAASATAAAPAPGGSPRSPLAPLRVPCADPDCGTAAPQQQQQHSIHELLDSPMTDAGGAHGSDSGCGGDAALEAAVADLLFSSTCALFAEPAAAPDFFTASPSTSPESSPLRSAGANSLSATLAATSSGAVMEDVACAGAGDKGYDKEDDEAPLSPTSIPGGWAAMSDGDSSSGGSDGGSGDEALLDAERTSTAAVAFGTLHQTAQQPSWPQHQAAPECCVFAWDAPPPAGTGAGGSSDACGGGLFEAPSSVVQYVPPPAARSAAGGGSCRSTNSGVPSALAQLAAEKAALKRQLRQLDADFEASTGRAPGRADKESLRPLYTRYWRLKRALAAAAAGDEAGPSMPAAAPQPVAMEA